MLALAFYFGGGSAASRGWSVNTAAAAPGTAQTAASSAPAAEASAAASSGEVEEKYEIPADSSAEMEENSDSSALTSAKEEDASSSAASSGAQKPAEQTSAGKTEQTAAPSAEKTQASSSEKTQASSSEKTQASSSQDGGELTCTISVSCSTLAADPSVLPEEKQALVPSDGWILAPTEVSFHEGESVFNVLLRTMKQNGIHFEYTDSPLYNAVYVGAAPISRFRRRERPAGCTA